MSKRSIGMKEINKQVKYVFAWIGIFIGCLFSSAFISLLLKYVIADSNYREIRYYLGFLSYSVIPIIVCKTCMKDIDFLEMLQWKKFIVKYLFGGLVGFVTCAMCLTGMFFFDKIVIVQEKNVNVILMLAYVVALILQGFGEEVLFRGMLLRIFKGHTVRGVVISSLFFSLAHILTPDTNLYTMVNIFLIGCFLAVLTIMTNSLWMASGFHALYNLTMTIGASLNTKYHYGHAFAYAENISGNNMFEYLEGNYFNTIAFLVAISILGVVYCSNKKAE